MHGKLFIIKNIIYFCFILIIEFSLFFESNALAEDKCVEHQVKAVLLYKFTSFIDWPESVIEDLWQPFVIGFLGQSPIVSIFIQKFSGQNIKGKKLIIQSFESVDQVNACHMIFVHHQYSHEIPSLMKKVKNLSTLIISESDRLIQQGGMINFVIENNTICFEINPSAAKDAGLTISSKLLRLAKIVN